VHGKWSPACRAESIISSHCKYLFSSWVFTCTLTPLCSSTGILCSPYPCSFCYPLLDILCGNSAFNDFLLISFLSLAHVALLPDVENRTVLIEGVLFRTRYLGSTKIASECNPSKARRMLQAQEAVGQIKVGMSGFVVSFFFL